MPPTYAYGNLHNCHAGNSASGGQLLAILPYKLVHAIRLAEFGYVSEALQYVAAVHATFSGLSKMPISLLVAKALAVELDERLRAHAMVWDPMP